MTDKKVLHAKLDLIVTMNVKNIITSKIKRKLATPLSYYKILNSVPIEKEGGIYVHTPYCDKICSFCNMNRKQVNNNLEEYTNYLIRKIEKLGKGTEGAYKEVRKVVEYYKDDRVMYLDINTVEELVKSNVLVKTVEDSIGSLNI